MSNIEFNAGMLKTLQNCENVKQIVSVAKSNGIDLSTEKAEKILSLLQKEELSDEEMDMMVGGESCADEVDAKCK